MRRGFGFHNRRSVINSGQSSSFTQGTLVGNGVTFTETRSTTGTLVDWEGVVRTALVNEARFNGLRRVQNLLSLYNVKSQDFSTWTSNPSGGTVTINGDGSVTCTASAAGQQPQVQVFTSIAPKLGQTFRLTVQVSAVSGALGNSVIAINTGLSTFSGQTNLLMPAVPGRYSILFTCTAVNGSTGFTIDLGAGFGNTSGAGSVTITNCQVEDVTGQSNQNPAEYVSVGVLSSPWNGAGVDGVKYFTTQNGNTVAANVVTAGTGAALPNGATYLQGLLVEPNAATNLALWCRDLTQTAWVKVNATAALDQIGVDGAPSSASSLVATLANGTALQTVTIASAQRTFSVYVKRLTGTGAVSISQDGVTWTAITGLINSSTYTQVTLTATQLNPVIGFQIASSADKIAVDYNQLEAGANASSVIATTTAAVVRAADTVIGNLAISNSSGSGAIDLVPLSATVTSFGRVIGAASATSSAILGISANTALFIYDQTNLIQQSSTFPPGTRTKLAGAYSGITMRTAKDGVAGTAGTFTGNMAFANSIQLLGDFNAEPGPNAIVFNVTFNTVTPATVASATV